MQNETPLERAAREAAYRATPEGAREILEREKAAAAEKINADIRQRFGGHDSGEHRGYAAIDLARTRLGITPEAERGAVDWMGEANAAEAAAELGESLALLDEATTPAEAEQALRELRKDPDFFSRMERGDVRARRVYRGLTAIAGRGQ